MQASATRHADADRRVAHLFARVYQSPAVCRNRSGQRSPRRRHRLGNAIEREGGEIEIGPLGVIEADLPQMRQLLQNLISNGLKFHRPEINPVVKIYGESCPSADPAEPNAQLFCLIVEDNGIGFEPQYAEQIFQVFQRLHGRDEFEGTGVGLAICRKIVERHAGTIAASSTPGNGAKFTVTLPVSRPAKPLEKDTMQ